jgi:putative transposase
VNHHIQLMRRLLNLAISWEMIPPRKSVNQENDGHEEEQIHGRADHRVPQAGRGGVAVKDLCRKGGFSDATFYKWRPSSAAWSVPDAKRLRELEARTPSSRSCWPRRTWISEALKVALGRKR